MSAPDDVVPRRKYRQWAGLRTPDPLPPPTPLEEATRLLAKWIGMRGTVNHYGGTVYFLQHETGGFVKIGVSVHVPSRLKSINSTTHDPRYCILATMPGAGNFYERLLHECFADLRMHGEWFRDDQDLLDFIEEVKRAQS